MNNALNDSKRSHQRHDRKFCFFFFYLCFHPTKVISVTRIISLHPSLSLTITLSAPLFSPITPLDFFFYLSLARFPYTLILPIFSQHVQTIRIYTFRFSGYVRYTLISFYVFISNYIQPSYTIQLP